jgi:hypothetical protein
MIHIKTLCILIITCFQALGVSAQMYSGQTKAVPVVSERLISLNGGMRATVGGQSRTVIPITLPLGTISWYYSFSTSTAGSGIKNLQLLMQLVAAASDPTTLSSLVLSQLQIPPGSQAIDIYLLDQYNADAFIQKWDLHGGTFHYIREGSVTATKQGIIPISNAYNNL